MTDKSVVPIDWSQPIEVVGHQKTSIPARVVAGPDADGDYRVAFGDGHPSWERGLIWWSADGTRYGDCRFIRNAPPASNPLNLETSDLDPITPEEDALATAIIAAMGVTRQSLHGVVRAIRAGLAKAGAVIVPGWQLIAIAPRDDTVILIAGREGISTAQWKERRSEWQVYTSENGWQECEVWPTHWMPLPSGHSIQSGGEGGEG